MLNLVMWQNIILLAGCIYYTLAECDVCQTNKVACTNSSSFYLCFGGEKPNTEYMYHCNDGFDCTDLNVICVQTSSQRPPSCGDTSLCGMCAAHRNYLFACLSRTTFQMCYGAVRPTGKIGYCPSGYVCYGGSDAVCVLEETIDSVTCDIVDDGGMTSPPTVTTENPGNEMLTPSEMCEQQRSIGLYPIIPNDPYCKRYIYCYYSNGIIRGREYTCSSGTYFHIQQEKCVFNKPTYCT